MIRANLVFAQFNTQYNQGEHKVRPYNIRIVANAGHTMKLDYPFIQLPLKFDAKRLLDEVNALDESAWQPHPQGYAGNDALTLITPHGINNNDEMSGPMQPTDYLKACPYLMQVLRCIGGVWGRTRLMRLSGQAEVTPHIDTNYYWRERMRVHVPIITQPSVRFYCADQDIHMQAGECWIFDTWSMHNVINDATQARIHLVADTVGGDQFWSWFGNSQPAGQNIPGWAAQEFATFNEHLPPIRLESMNLPDVMTPWEMREHFNFLFNEAMPHPALQDLSAITFELCLAWQALWIECGNDVAAYPKYARLRDAYMESLRPFDFLLLKNGYPLIRAISQSLILHCLKDVKRTFKEHRDTGQETPAPQKSPAAFVERTVPADAAFNKPLIVVSSPRSGSTMFFEALEKSPDLCSIGGESHALIESIAELHPASRHFDSNVLTASQCTPEIALELQQRFYHDAFKPNGSKPLSGEPMRLLEKTPKNALRIPFMQQLFADAQFIYLYRNPKQVISSMLDAWQSGRFKTYPDLPGWTGLPWSLLLTPNWRDLIGKPLHHVVAHQWNTATQIMLDDLETLDQSSVVKIRYETLLAKPHAELHRICTSCGINAIQNLSEFPLSKHTITLPDPDKWKRNESLIDEIWPIIETQALRAERYMADTP